jgi:MFS family permease
MARGFREVMGNRWQIAFAAGDLTSALVALILLELLVPPTIAWRIVLGLGAVWAIIILILRSRVPESVMWLVKQGKFREAKRLAQKYLNDPLSMLPDMDIQIPKPKLRQFIRVLRRDRITWRTALFGWLSNWCQAAEAAPFGLLLAYFLEYFKITTTIGAIGWTALFYFFGLLSAIIWPQLLPRLGQRNFQIIGYGMATVALLLGLYSVLTHDYTVLLADVPFMGFAIFTPSQTGMTISSMVAPPEYRGTASGFAYQFVKWPYFVGYTIVPALMALVGAWFSPAFALIWAVVGLLGAIFLLPKEIKFGYRGDVEV